jgi:hypothetical protein
MRSSVLLLPLLLLAFQSHQTSGRGEPSLEPVTAAGWRGMLPVSALEPLAAEDRTRPGCTQGTGRPDARGAAPSGDPRPIAPATRSSLNQVSTTDPERYTPPFLANQAVDSAGIRHGVSS